MLADFRKFIMRGNVLDLAVAVVIGAAFGAVVASFVSDLIMPLIGAATGGIDFSSLYINLSGKTFELYSAAKEAGVAAVLGYGAFITTIINFLIIAWVIFMILQAYNRFLAKPAPPAPPAEPTAEEKLLTEICDLLKQRSV